MPKADNAHTTSRRTLLASAALLPAIAAAAEDVASDPHLAWFAEWRALVAWADTADLGGRDLDAFPQYHRTLALEELIHGTPARTPGGALAQLRILNHWHGNASTFSEADRTGLENALATLERLAGEARHV